VDSPIIIWSIFIHDETPGFQFRVDLTFNFEVSLYEDPKFAAPMMRRLVGLLALAGSGLAFPFAAEQEGIQNGHIIRRQQVFISI
jgi:hypothetical protein